MDELLLDPAEGPDEIPRAELVRLASLNGAMVEVVEGHDGLQRLGGSGRSCATATTDGNAI